MLRKNFLPLQLLIIVATFQSIHAMNMQPNDEFNMDTDTELYDPISQEFSDEEYDLEEKIYHMSDSEITRKYTISFNTECSTIAHAHKEYLCPKEMFCKKSLHLDNNQFIDIVVYTIGKARGSSIRNAIQNLNPHKVQRFFEEYFKEQHSIEECNRWLEEWAQSKTGIASHPKSDQIILSV